MSDNLQQIEILEELKVFFSLSEEFHTVNHLIPDDQELQTIPPDALVIDVLKTMRENHFSQIPVMAGNTVLGVFSYRSFAENFVKISSMKEKPDVKQLRVMDFIEKPNYVQVSEDIEIILKSLSDNDYLLVGQKERLLALITPLDLARNAYLYATVYELFREIELTIRRIIQACTNEEQFQECIHQTLTGIYKEEDKLPKSVQEMTVSDYAQVIGDGRCYFPYFEKVFGVGDPHRRRTRLRLEEIRELRNDAFHFRRDLNIQDLETLLDHRDWLRNIAIVYDANSGVKNA